MLKEDAQEGRKTARPPDAPATKGRLAGDRFSAILFGSFAGMALLLAALGIYGVMSFVVAQRKHELGVRFALGATRANVLGLVLKDGLAVALVGTALGFLGAFWLGRAMQGMFEGVPGLDTRGSP